MTQHELRAVLRAHRLERGLSYDALARDIREVLGMRRVSTTTVRRFLLAETRLHETVEFALRTYVERVRQAAVA